MSNNKWKNFTIKILKIKNGYNTYAKNTND